MRAYTSTQSTALDLAAQAAGVAGFELMRRAGMAAFVALGARFPECNRLIVLAGKGNNGGDAWIVAGAAHAAGWSVCLWPVTDELPRADSEAGQAREWALRQGISDCLVDYAGLEQFCARADVDAARTVVVDGILGTGLREAPRVDAANAIEWINASGMSCLALDVPSGLSADHGAAPGVVVQADITLTFIGMKLGLLTGRGPDVAGHVMLESLGVDVQRLEAGANGVPVLNERHTWLPARRPGAYKNELGHVVVLAGDHGGGGAASLTAEAALRSGAGLVSVGTRAEHIAPLLARRPELMVRSVAGKLAALELLQRGSVVVVGPGLGQAAWGQQLYAAAVDAAASRSLAVVVDADALNLVAAGAPLPEGAVITPHSGEAARLLGVSNQAVEGDRVSAVAELARRYRCVAVLKGAGTLIADTSGVQAVCALGNPGMATAGMGDTLAGIVAALVAQQGATSQSVGWAVQVHAAAGDRAALRLSQTALLAGDVIDELPHVLSAAPSEIAQGWENE